MTIEAQMDSRLELELLPLPGPFPTLPLLRTASGLYSWTQVFGIPHVPIATPDLLPISPPSPIGLDGAALVSEVGGDLTTGTPLALRSEQLRLDVDGRYPQMTVSGTVSSILPAWRVHWIARLVAAGADAWTGAIWYKDGAVAAFPYTSVRVEAHRSFFPANQTATVTFYVGATKSLVRAYKYASSYFHPMEFEYDCAAGTASVTSFRTDSHPVRPATLPAENLTVEAAFRRAGFDVKLSGGPSTVPISLAGVDKRWSDNEMHDAMVAYWSRFANKAQWAAWIFFASLHEQGSSLGGIMFDDIGPNHRQGTAIFEDAFISVPPATDPAPAAWVQRMRFWTAVHETGHTFNLAHAWQKSVGTPWIPLANEPEARSFMNYPYRVAGGVNAFFGNFEYRFSNQELLFLRHAPERFVQQGNAAWFDHHGFEQGEPPSEHDLQLEIRVNREIPSFDFMEPAVIELKLKNVSYRPQLIPENVLLDADHAVVIVRRKGQAAKQYLPYARYCLEPSIRALAPGEAMYESLFVAAGKGGWNIAEPGDYLIQVMIQVNEVELVSNRIEIRVRPPAALGELILAQDFFTDDVGRVLNFDGSRVLNAANNTLREVVNQMGGSKAALHAAVAVALPLTKEYKTLSLGSRPDVAVSAQDTRGTVSPEAPDMAEAGRLLNLALMERPNDSAESLGHIDYRYYVDALSKALADAGDLRQAADAQGLLLSTLSGRGVLTSVLEEIDARRQTYRA